MYPCVLHPRKTGSDRYQKLVDIYPCLTQLRKTSYDRYHTETYKFRLLIYSDKVELTGSKALVIILNVILFKKLKLLLVSFRYRRLSFSILKSSQILLFKCLKLSQFNLDYRFYAKVMKTINISAVIKKFHSKIKYVSFFLISYKKYINSETLYSMGLGPFTLSKNNESCFILGLSINVIW